jgi:3-hydroxyisobutyrate dehydrogenase
MKLLHNSVCHSIFLINCEILNIAKSYGINDIDVIDVFNKSNARSYISESRFPNNILNGKFNGKSSIKNLKKDLGMINLILKKSNSKKKYTELSNEILSKIDDNLDMKDFTNIYKMWDKI